MKNSFGTKLTIALSVMFLSLCCVTSSSAEDTLYQSPGKPIADLVEKPSPPQALMTGDHKNLVFLHQTTLQSISDISQPELRLAGYRLDPKTNGPSRRSYYVGVSVQDITKSTNKPVPVTGIPQGAKLSTFNISPDDKYVAFFITEPDAIKLWVFDIATKTARKLCDAPVNCFGGSSITWNSDNTILLTLIPEGRGTPPEKELVPRGPLVQENDGRKRPARPDQDLLKSVHDENVFDYYATAQIARIYLDGRVEKIGKPDVYYSINPSPDAKHILVNTLHKPYSYKVGMSRFPHRVEVWSATGAVEKLVADNPLAEEIPIDFSATSPFPRSFDWRSDKEATLTWVEARDGGDPKKDVAVRDELLMLDAPFADKPKVIGKTSLRYSGVTWGSGELALISEWWWTNRKSRTFIFEPDHPEKEPRVLWDYSFEDRYADPGSPDLEANKWGHLVLDVTPKGQLLLNGQGASPEGDRPFLDALDLKTLKTTRMWRSEAPYFERVMSPLNEDGSLLLTSRQSVYEPPQYFLRDLRKKTLNQITNFENPNPDALGKVEKKLIKYKRADGVQLSGYLYTPPGFEPGKSKPLPVLMWVYPSEFKTKDAAGQIQDSPYRFVRVSHSGPLFALMMGFAVLDDPTMPIVGEGKEEPNDTYVKQLISDAQAAIDEVVKLGVGDRDRMAIGGHSYGAFTTANLLAHSNLFRAGIARSGAFNRTLTPFGFQSEERNFWDAMSTYIEMSPFTHANKIDEPLLIIHGGSDENKGTFPMQSERLFEAMTGLGGRARWVVLPNETHGYRARESVLHMLKEMADWLNKYVAPNKTAAK